MASRIKRDILTQKAQRTQSKDPTTKTEPKSERYKWSGKSKHSVRGNNYNIC